MKTRINRLAVWILVVIHQMIGFGWDYSMAAGDANPGIGCSRDC